MTDQTRGLLRLYKAVLGEDAFVSRFANDADGEKLMRSVQTVLSSLPPREERVLKMRLGIGTRMHLQKEIGDPKQIREIEGRALRKLKHPSRSRRLRSFVAPLSRPAPGQVVAGIPALSR